jgi:hypothetical protein
MRSTATNLKSMLWMVALFLCCFLPTVDGIANTDSTKATQPVHQLRSAALNHQNHFPLILPIGFLLQAPLEFRQNQSFEFSLQQNYSAIHFFKNSTDREIGLDMEYLHYQFNLGYMINPAWSLQLTYGLSWHWDGFLDPFLIWYHEKYNLPNYGREKRDPNDFYYVIKGPNVSEEVSIQHRKWYSNDPVLSIYHHLMSNEKMRLSLGFNAQFPVWNLNEGINNRSLNMGMSGYFSYRNGSIDLFQSIYLLVPGNADHFIWQEAKTSVSAGTALAWMISEKHNVLAQLNYGQSPFRDTRGNRLDDPPIELIIGYRYNGKLGRYTFSFSEDLLIPAPDFTISLTYELPVN